MKRWVVLGLIGLFSVTTMAQTDRENLSVDSMVEKLAPAPKTRGLTRNLVPTQAKLDLTIHFDFNSDKLQERGLAGFVGAVEHLHAGAEAVDGGAVEGSEAFHLDAFDEHGRLRDSSVSGGR
jgi:hypothetical protein